MSKKTYVFTVGKHVDSNGKKYAKGDKIELTDEQAKGLANKIVDPNTFGIDSSEIGPSKEEANAMLERIAELEKEVEELKEAVEEED